MLVVFAGGCAKCGEEKPAPKDDAVLAPAPAPDRLLAEIVVTSPNASWNKLQRGIGGALGILPATLPGLIVTLSDLDPLLGGELDGTSPIYAVLAGDPEGPEAVFASRVIDPRRARGLLFDSDIARFRAREGAGMTFLVPKMHPEDQKTAAALTESGWFVVGRSAAEIERLAPYVTRTLPTRPVPAEAAVIDVPRSALDAIVKPKLDARWADAKGFLLGEDARMRQERGRAPDFGDPVALVAAFDGFVARRLAIVGDLERVRITVDVEADAASLAIALTPRAGGEAKAWVDGMKIGDPSAALAMPITSTLAIASRDGEEGRAAQSKELEKVLTTTLGARLKEADAKLLHDGLEDVLKARDEVAAVALSLDEPSGIFVRAPARDRDAAVRTIRGALELGRHDPFRDLLRVREITTADEELPLVGKVSVATVARVPKKSEGSRGRLESDAGVGAKRDVASVDGGAGVDGGAKVDGGTPAPAAPSTAKAGDTTGLAWGFEQGALLVAMGAEPTVTYRLAARPDKRLSDEPTVARFASTLGDTASTVVVAQPLRADPTRAHLPPAPLLLSVGRKGGEGLVRLSVSDGLLREIVRSRMGF